MSLFEVHPSIADPEVRRQSRLLGVCLAVLVPSFFCVDLALTLFAERHQPPFLGYALMAVAFLLNRAGRYSIAAVLIVAMFPLVGIGLVFGGETTLPLATMHYMALAPLLSTIFLSLRSVIVTAALNVFGIALASRIAPSVSHLDGTALVGPLTMNAIVGVLASLYLYHRNGVEADRQAALLAQIEERKEVEHKLLQAQKMEALGHFAGGIAHDFNNVLMVIQGHAGRVMRRAPGPELQLIEEAISTAASLTRQLLAFGRLAVIEPTVLDVGPVVGEVVTMVRRIIGESIQVDQSLPNAPLLARLDRAQLEQILINLATNARDAMPNGGTLRISAAEVDLRAGSKRLPPDAKPGVYACLQVADTGVGMDEATYQRAFEPFFTTKARGRGTGLGLSTVFGIVSQSGGFIRMSSLLGKGTRVELYFPLSLEQPRHASSVVLKATDTRGAERVLLVEDDDSVRLIVSMILSEAGYEVLRASTKSEGQRIWSTDGSTIALLITDMVLSDGSGLDLAEQVRKRRPEVAVLCISGYAEREGLMSGSPGFAHLQKPFAGEALLISARGLIDQAAEAAAQRAPKSASA